MQISKKPAVQVLLLLLVLTADVTASPSSDAGGETASLNLQQALSKALANNPGIAAARIDADIQRARSSTLSLGTPYRLEGDIENVAGSGEFSGFDASETTLRLSKTLETGDKREHRQNLGDMRSQLAMLEISMRESSLAAEVSRRYAQLLRQQEAIGLVEESVAIGQRTLDIVRKRVAVGKASDAEEASAVVSLARIELAGKRLDFEIVATRAGLATLWGDAEPAFAHAAGDIYSMPPLPQYSHFASRLAGNADVLRIETEARIRGAEQRIALADQRADVELTAGVRHLAAIDDVAMVVGFSVPFGTKGRGAAAVSEADSGIARTALDRNGQMLELQAAMRALFQQLLASRNELMTLRPMYPSDASVAKPDMPRAIKIAINAKGIQLTVSRFFATRASSINGSSK